VELHIMQSVFSSAARLVVRRGRRKKSWSRAGELKIHWAEPLAGCAYYGFCMASRSSKLVAPTVGSEGEGVGGLRSWASANASRASWEVLG
jgi:hypothetical protein